MSSFPPVRTTLLALALVLAACGRAERAGSPPAADAPATALADRPTDQIVLRLPRAGGVARAVAYPAVDSLLWQASEPTPPAARVLAFDASTGSAVALDAKGAPLRLDLRQGTVTRQREPTLSRLTSADGWAVYGVAGSGGVVRLTPVGSWSFRPPVGARAAFAQPDGSLIVAADRGPATVLWRLRPPETAILDSAVLPRAERIFGTLAGDRLYMAVDSGLIGVSTAGLAPVPSVRFRRPVRSVTTTPSGDRIYVATDSSAELTVVDRYTERVDTRIALPAPAAELRMDPMGRYLLARAAHGDSVWVVGVGSDQVVGAVRSAWRDDLPAVAPDGQVALLRGKDVVFVGGETLSPRDTVPGGGADVWAFLTWDGFRPDTRATTLAAAEPAPDTTADVTANTAAAAPAAPGSDSTAAAGETAPDLPGLVGDTASANTADSGGATTRTPGARPTVPVPPPVPPPTGPPNATGAPSVPQQFTVQLAALRSEQAARDLARSLTGPGTAPRVIATPRAGVTIYRVILGPFATRAEAERAAAGVQGQSVWIYEGRP